MKIALLTKKPKMSKDVYPANAFAGCVQGCKGIIPGDQVHTWYGRPVRHAKGYCR